ncbi:MAG: T9SS type A sorting domain-containing protein [Flavobacteriales bacterium]|nr:T9SS type A sorting domain-containing protein [Flavobacteriales bacterium]MCB9364537.1 T9SS type A sorting domain-containing protein [Flavobacteriales bacterium]
MKKLVSFLFIGGVSLSVYSQNNQPIIIDQPIKFDKTNITYNTSSKASCSVDTISYTEAKATGVVSVGVYAGSSSAPEGISQYFTAPQDITIHGFSFYAYKADSTDNGTTIDAVVEVYLADGLKLPNGTALVSDTIAIDTTFGGGNLSALKKDVVFDSPIVVNQPYVIVVRNYSTNLLGVVISNYNNSDGGQEWLWGLNVLGNWNNSSNYALDADFLVYPIVSYDIDASFTINDCLSVGGGNVSFTNTSSPIINDAMYNQFAYLGATDTSYVYDFGDGSPTTYNENPTHNYTTSQTYTVTLVTYNVGWKTTCLEQATGVVDICTGINELNNNNIQLYPNPVQNTLNISGVSKNTTINVYDVAGKLVLQDNVINQNLHVVPTTSLNTGIYFVKIISDSNVTSTFKIVKQ